MITLGNDVLSDLKDKHGPVWVNRQGEYEPLVLMSDRRLQSCVEFVNRQLDDLIFPYSLPSPHGEMAAYMLEQDQDRAFEDYDKQSSALRWWKVALAVEIKRRGAI